MNKALSLPESDATNIWDKIFNKLKLASLDGENGVIWADYSNKNKASEMYKSTLQIHLS